MDRKLASAQRVLALNPIPGADRIEVATILGWKVVVKKDEFKVNDLCVFFEIDSILPFSSWNAFLDKKGKQEPIRLKTVKMKGQISQGLALPLLALSVTPEVALIACLQAEKSKHDHLYYKENRPEISDLAYEKLYKVWKDQEGVDLTEALKITKYEPNFGKNDLDAIGLRPEWIFKTDEQRIQSMPELLKLFKGKEVYITQKLDGSSMTVARHPTEGDKICSRNMSLSLSGDNKFTRVGNVALPKVPVGYIVQGELVGPGVQDNRLGLTENQFRVFNVFKLDENGSTHLGYPEMFNFCKIAGIEHVPVIYDGPFIWNTIEELLTLAVGTYANGHPQEGIVIRPAKPEKHPELGILSFKVVNNEFLMKVGE